jgi:hypothetical protein
MNETIFDIKDVCHEIYHETLVKPYINFAYCCDNYELTDKFFDDLDKYDFELYGSWNDWKEPILMKDNGVVWSCVIDAKPGIYECKLKLNDNWFFFTGMPIVINGSCS